MPHMMRDSTAGLMLTNDEWEQMRESWERMSGMDEAISKIREHFKQTGQIPRSLKNALAQGVDAALTRYKEAISGMALVAALFLVGSLTHTIEPPEYILNRLESTINGDETSIETGWDPIAISYGTTIVMADASFFFCIMFYGHLTHYLSWMFHRDADVLLWLFEVDFEQYVTTHAAIPLVLGIILYAIAITIAMGLIFPPYVVCTIFSIGLVMSIHLGFTHRKLGAISLLNFISRQDSDATEQVELLLSIHETRARQWIRLKEKITSEYEMEDNHRASMLDQRTNECP